MSSGAHPRWRQEVLCGDSHSLSCFLLAASSLAAATFTVTNTNDSGAGSLRQAILDANANPGDDTIAFNIPGSGVQTIAVAEQSAHRLGSREA